MIQDIAPHRYSTEYQQKKPKDTDTVFVFGGLRKREHRMLCKEIMEEGISEGELAFPTAGQLLAAGAGTEDMQFLFSIDGADYYLLMQFGTVETALQLSGYSYEPNRLLRRCRPQLLCFAAMTAYHLFDWYQVNQFCGCCGAKTKPFEKERAIRCPDCGNLVFPKICPAVIIGLRNGSSILTSRYAGREYKGVALLAGFCEIGETVEETVAREVMEEVGLKVKNITYYKSQPWGFDSNLLLGFYCDVDGDTDITIDRDELAIAEWTDRETLRNSPDNLLALTGEMIDTFRRGEDR